MPLHAFQFYVLVQDSKAPKGLNFVTTKTAEVTTNAGGLGSVKSSEDGFKKTTSGSVTSPL